MGRGIGRLLAALVALLALVGAAPAAVAQPPLPDPVDPVERVLGRLLPPQVLGPGVVQRDFTTSTGAGEVLGHLVEVDLTNPAVETDLLTAGPVAARAQVADMANARGAVAGINGDFFDIDGTNAAAGPAVAEGRPLKAAVPAGQRAAPPLPPGTTADAVFGVGAVGARVGRLTLDARAVGPLGTVPVTALNQYAIPTGGVGLFTPEWGSASRARAVCGSDTSAGDPCSSDVREVVLRGGVVTAVRDRPGSGAIAPDSQVLLGRGAGAAALGALRVGDRVDVPYRLVAPSGPGFDFAVGGTPILRDGRPLAGLDDAERAPRSAAATDPLGRRMYLVTVDGRQDDSVGATLSEFGTLLGELGMDDAVNLDGGGSSTLVYQRPGEDDVTVVNDPSDSAPRAVSNGIGVFLRR